jgi:hypothetical protein
MMLLYLLEVNKYKTVFWVLGLALAYPSEYKGAWTYFTIINL